MKTKGKNLNLVKMYVYLYKNLLKNTMNIACTKLKNIDTNSN